jgi:hypothetical protein
VQGLRLDVHRKLLILTADASLCILSERVVDKSYRSKNFYYDPGEERSNIVHIHLPVSVEISHVSLI